MTNKTSEICENCIWWDGDSSGHQGVCTHDPDKTAPEVVTGRFESCVNVMVREIPDTINDKG